VFPVRYDLNSYILFRRNSVFKGLNMIDPIPISVLVQYTSVHAHCWADISISINTFLGMWSADKYLKVQCSLSVV
jgi:hypothetical protein